MKKLISAALAAFVSFAPVALSAEESKGNEVPGSTTIDVSGKFDDQTTEVDKYSVDIEWGAMQFTYSVSGTKTWNPSTHEFDFSTEDTWTPAGNTVKVTNHSSKEVTAELTFSPEAAYSEVQGAFDTAQKTLVSGQGRSFEEADSFISTLVLSGKLGAETVDFTKIGTVTVNLK